MNVLGLLFLVMFILSVLGVYMFRKCNSGEVIDNFSNFKNLVQAIVLLFRCSTGEDWHRVMFDLELDPNNTNRNIFLFIINFQ